MELLHHSKKEFQIFQPPCPDEQYDDQFVKFNGPSSLFTPTVNGCYDVLKEF